MQLKTLLTRAAWVIAFLLVAAASYAGLAAGMLLLFASLFPASGHPPLPAAPTGWYPFGFLVVCPLLALAVSAGVVHLLRCKWRRRAPRP